MASLGQIYQAADMPESTFTPIPAGWYMATVKDADLKDTKDGRGQYISLQWEILGPSHEGRLVFDIINIENGGENREKVIRIGMQQLGSIMRACGLPKVGNTDELLGVRCEVKVDLDKPQEGYDQRNRIKDYRAPEGGSAAPRIGTPKTAQATTAPAAKAAPPWKK